MDDHEGDHDTQFVPSDLSTESTEQSAHQDDDHDRVTHDSEYVPFDTAGQRPAIDNDCHHPETGAVTDLTGLPLLEICKHNEVPDPIPDKFANREEDLQEEDEDCHQKILSIGIRPISKNYVM
jgi:hypothetical protein